MGEGALGGVHEQEHPVHHLQDPLHLAPEISVPGGVDDVDLDPIVINGSVLGKDSDAAFALQGIGVHHPFLDDLVGTENPRLPEHGVNQGGLAMVDMGDDGDVADIFPDRQIVFLSDDFKKLD